MNKARLCPFSVTRAYISDNTDYLTPEDINLVLGLVRARDFRSLASLSSKFEMHSIDLELYRIVRQVEAFFKKNADFADDAYCTAQAKQSFRRAETLCRITNKRLDYFYSHPERISPELEKVIARAQDLISQVLGPIEPFIEGLPSSVRLTAGASASSPRIKSMPFLKLKRTMDATAGTFPYLDALYRYYGYVPPRKRFVTCNRVELVPKSWKTHRTIACEPTGNVPFQLAFDTYVKKRLRKFNITDLSNQEENQRLAKVGSESGSYATIDLAMASDTLSFNTVAWLLPSEWFEIVKAFRCPQTIFDGKLLNYSKFSSMGNGTTFALETLVFASLLEAVSYGTYAVYGDDLVVRTDSVQALIGALKFFGFIVNEEKSYTSGPFRESCGKDYYLGEDITPFYLRKTDPWDKPYACHNVNGLRRLTSHGALWDYLASFVKDARLPLCPINEDTLSGVHVSAYHAYKQRLIKSNPRGSGDLYALQYCRKTETRFCRDSRALALWFHSKEGSRDSRRVDGRPYFQGECSRYTTDSHKFRRRWMRWLPPVQVEASENLFWFSENVIR